MCDYGSIVKCDSCGYYARKEDLIDLYDPENCKYYLICKDCAHTPGIALTLIKIKQILDFK